ncbi:hypothetical protein CMQ_6728 [Grosmannia clavigera kw1407]|uniref:Uncharacterized protein n=1 Tax=Grosmannia clavigera (strain kw1407 / UAMH 11150) TaxID=655863 RepID=F0X721_GROCL|nr:uncharacterized protein CMQ_6728 [Grosmannia clavigera kw1407]EFX06407.1 hypothetical protein CMQ_6728 [Grosmannia clavigera kw1407]
MDVESSRSGSPTPLQVASPERINKQRESALFSADSSSLGFSSSTASVTDKISQFNSLASQSKQLERKTADAALKRAMLGREEAEAEMRRCRDEVRQLRKQMEEGRDRERRVGERLETVMENYGRSKETHAHTQALWEKEIRRARKETFKSQSTVVKLQEELKAARSSTKAAQEALEHEKQRSKAREQEAFQARYELVGCQEQLQQAQQMVKTLEQERDAFKSLAKSEEDMVRIASEGRLPLPPPDEQEKEEEEKAEEEAQAETKEDDMADDTPAQSETEQVLALAKTRRKSGKPCKSSASLLDIQSSAASEAEIDELTRQWQWEKQRADRASELVEYLEAECHLRACSCARKRPRSSTLESARKRPALGIEADVGERVILGDKASIITSSTAQIRANMQPIAKKMRQEDSSLYAPEDGVFRTVSQQMTEESQEMQDLQDAHEASVTSVATTAVAASTRSEEQPETSLHKAETVVVAEIDTATGNETAEEPSMYARSPSAEPPSFAVLAKKRTSLLSLLDAPHRNGGEATPGFHFHVPTTSVAPDIPADMVDTADVADTADTVEPTRQRTSATAQAFMRLANAIDSGERRSASSVGAADESRSFSATYTTAPEIRHSDVQDYMELDVEPEQQQQPVAEEAGDGPYAVKTTVTRVPLREETAEPSLAQRLMAAQRTPTQRSTSDHSDVGSESSFDVTTPALTPTMSREECLAQIRERRGRARSVAGSQRTARSGSVSSSGRRSVAATAAPAASTASAASAAPPVVAPRRPVTPGSDRRDVSAPVRRTGSVRRR